MAANVPLVASSEVAWSDRALWADPNHCDAISKKIIQAVRWPRPARARRLLADAVRQVPSVWEDALLRIT